MIKVETCKGCGGVILVDDFMGLRVRCDPTTLDAQTAGQALVGGLTLYWVSYLGGRPHTFGSATVDVLKGLRSEVRPMVVAQHRCPQKAAGSPRTTPNVSEATPRPKVRETAAQSLSVAHGAPSSAPSTGIGPADTAVSPVSDASGRPEPLCETCGLKMAAGTYAAIELGNLLLWTAHIEGCSP